MSNNNIITQVTKDDVEGALFTAVEENGTSGKPQQQNTRQPVRKPARTTRRLLRALFCCLCSDADEDASTPKGAFNGAQSSACDATHGLTPYSPKQSEKALLPPIRSCDSKKKCLIIDLDETLVHSSFKPVKNPDFIIPVEIDGVIHQRVKCDFHSITELFKMVYVLKRPFVDEFLLRIGNIFECILFTASLAKYADPVADLLDQRGMFRARLFRDACVFHKGNYVKDLNRLSRDLKRVIIIDNSPASYAFHPDNALPVSSWFDDVSDTELLDLVPMLERLAAVDDVLPLLRNCNEPAADLKHTLAPSFPSSPAADDRLSSSQMPLVAAGR